MTTVEERAFLEAMAAKHLPGRHDQSSHGRRRGSAVADAVRLTPDAAREMQAAMVAEKPWTPGQRHALNGYTAFDYEGLNHTLRNPDSWDEYDDDMRADVRRQVKAIQDAMRPLPASVTVTRAADFHAFGIANRPPQALGSLQALKGKTLQEPGFLSTSITDDAFGTNLPVRLDLDLPKGTPAAYVEEVSDNPEEYEMLLGPGTRMKILSVDTSVQPALVKAVVVPQGKVGKSAARRASGAESPRPVAGQSALTDPANLRLRVIEDEGDIFDDPNYQDILSSAGRKHLPGRHDQSTHGRHSAVNRAAQAARELEELRESLARAQARQPRDDSDDSATGFRWMSPDDAMAMRKQMLEGDPWTPEQQDALNRYTGDAYYQMNGLLRGDPDVDAELSEGEKAEFSGLIRDAAQGLRPTTQPVKVKRFVGGFVAFGLDPNTMTREEMADALRAMKGKTLQEPGFMSTSLSETYGAETWVGRVKLELDVPAGAQGAYLDGDVGFQREQELLLAPGSRFEITDVVIDPPRNTVKGRVVVQADPVKALLADMAAKHGTHNQLDHGRWASVGGVDIVPDGLAAATQSDAGAGGVREVLTVGSRQGSADMAERFAIALTSNFDGFSGPEMFGFEHVGSGSQREVWVDDTGTVYKFGLDSANRQEARTMKRLRDEGADYAPDVTLYEVEVDIAEPYEEPRRETRTVIAMPYLPEDGSVEHAGLVLPGAGDFNPENVVSNGGRLWLVDAGGM